MGSINVDRVMNSDDLLWSSGSRYLHLNIADPRFFTVCDNKLIILVNSKLTGRKFWFDAKQIDIGKHVGIFNPIHMDVWESRCIEPCKVIDHTGVSYEILQKHLNSNN